MRGQCVRARNDDGIHDSVSFPDQSPMNGEKERTENLKRIASLPSWKREIACSRFIEESENLYGNGVPIVEFIPIKSLVARA